MVWNGAITDVKTIIGLVWVDKVLKSNKKITILFIYLLRNYPFADISL